MLSPSKYFLLPLIGLAASIAPQALPAQLSSNATVVATGLEGPRGLRFGPDGDLYVAEAGTGGSNATTPEECAQVPAPVGPYKGGLTGRISKFDKNWTRTTVASGFPSALNGMKQVSGVADVQFLFGNLYALIAGGGCSHGNPTMPNGVAWVNTYNGSWRYVADISEFMHASPVKYSNADDFEPDGDPYSMTAANGALHAVEGNSGQLLRVNPNSGNIFREIDVSASQGHIVPTSVAFNNGTFLLGNLNVFPIEQHTSRVMTLQNFQFPSFAAPGLDVAGPLYISSSKAGFATIVGLEIGPNGLLYVLQFAPDTPSGYPAPGYGKVTRVNRDGSLTDVVTGLSVPTGMTFGRDGKLYISNFGAAPAGAGQIVMATVP